MFNKLVVRGLLSAVGLGGVLAATAMAPAVGATGISTVIVPTCTAVTISASPTSVTYKPSAGTHVIATAAATGCTTSARYEFWLRPASSSAWTKVQAYGTGATYDWNTTGARPGIVYIGVRAKDVNSTALYDQAVSTSVTVLAALCTSAGLTTAPTTVVHGSGTHVIATGTGTGCTNSALYEFWFRPGTSKVWTMVQAYSATATWSWMSMGAPIGTDYIGVRVKDLNSISSSGYDALASAAVTVT